MWYRIHLLTAHRISSRRWFVTGLKSWRFSSSLRRLHFGQRGWITLDEAASLFSPMDDQFAFGELDDEGKRIFAEFALMPTAFAIIEAVQWVASTGFAAFF